MKRKFKLFATVASLCLSVALMAFGVYAATQASYRVTSTVSFAAQVTGTWKYKVENAAWDNAVSGQSEALVGSEINGDEVAVQSVDLADLEFDLSKAGGNVITYTFQFVSSSDSPTWVKAKAASLFNVGVANDAQLEVRAAQAAATEIADTVEEDVYTVITTTNAATLASENGTEWVELAAGGTYTLVIKVELLDATKQLTAANNKLDITLTAVSADPNA